jgi:CheY-like chemotaxis protein
MNKKIGTGKRLLLIEGNKLVKPMLEAMLNNMGFQTTVASNGGQALTQLSVIKFDLVLLDLDKPEEAGFKFLEDIAEHPPTFGTPPVIVARRADDDKGREAKLDALLRQGTIISVMKKPLASQTLEAELNRLQGFGLWQAK